jgi:hypothetical protein
VPLAWKIAFDEAKDPNIEGMGNRQLGMNAHQPRPALHAGGGRPGEAGWHDA